MTRAYNGNRSPQFYLKIPLILRLMFWDDYKWSVESGKSCLVVFCFYRFELQLGLLNLYQIGRFLGYWSFWIFAREPRSPGRLGIGIRDGFGRAWAEYNLR